MTRQRNYDHPPLYAESNASATYRTVNGWVSRTGRFFGEFEGDARKAGSEVHLCTINPDHGAVPNRGYCEACAVEGDLIRWEKLSKMTPAQFAETESFFLFSGDEFFRDTDEVRDFALDNDLQEVRLVNAEPSYMCLEGVDQFSDITPDDGVYVDGQLEAAEVIIAEANVKLRALGVLSYFPGKLGYLYIVEND